MAIQQDAKDVYTEVDGDYDRFRQIMVERGYTDMQCLNLHQALLKEQGWIDPKAPLTLGTMTRVVPFASEPVKRTIVIMLEMELTEEEDTFQTAELAVELLNGDMDNQVTLIAAAEKQ